jgi:transposase
MRALFGCGTPKEAAGMGSAFLFAIQTDFGFTTVIIADIEGTPAMLVIAIVTDRP